MVSVAGHACCARLASPLLHRRKLQFISRRTFCGNVSALWGHLKHEIQLHGKATENRNLTCPCLDELESRREMTSEDSVLCWAINPCKDFHRFCHKVAHLCDKWRLWLQLCSLYPRQQMLHYMTTAMPLNIFFNIRNLFYSSNQNL